MVSLINSQTPNFHPLLRFEKVFELKKWLKWFTLVLYHWYPHDSRVIINQ